MTEDKAPDDQQLEVCIDDYQMDQLDDFEAQLRLDIYIIDSGWETAAHAMLKRSSASDQDLSERSQSLHPEP